MKYDFFHDKMYLVLIFIKQLNYIKKLSINLIV